MIEFSEDFGLLYSGKDAVRQRVLTRLKHTTHDIPYYERGVDIDEFTYGDKGDSIRMGLRDMNAEVSGSGGSARIVAYDVVIDVEV